MDSSVSNNQLEGTKYKLVADIQKVLAKGGYTGENRAILKKAREGYYHDFESPIPMPKVQLVRDLEEARLPELAQKVRDGEYDE